MAVLAFFGQALPLSGNQGCAGLNGGHWVYLAGRLQLSTGLQTLQYHRLTWARCAHVLLHTTGHRNAV